MSAERPELNLNRRTIIEADVDIPPAVLFNAAQEWCRENGITLPAGDWKLSASGCTASGGGTVIFRMYRVNLIPISAAEAGLATSDRADPPGD